MRKLAVNVATSNSIAEQLNEFQITNFSSFDQQSELEMENESLTAADSQLALQKASRKISASVSKKKETSE